MSGVFMILPLRLTGYPRTSVGETRAILMAQPRRQEWRSRGPSQRFARTFSR